MAQITRRLLDVFNSVANRVADRLLLIWDGVVDKGNKAGERIEKISKSLELNNKASIAIMGAGAIAGDVASDGLIQAFTAVTRLPLDNSILCLPILLAGMAGGAVAGKRIHKKFQQRKAKRNQNQQGTGLMI